MKNTSTTYHTKASFFTDTTSDIIENGIINSLCPQLTANTDLCTDTADAVPYLPENDTEHELAILFLDIRNFTGLMENHPAAEVIRVVRSLFTAFNQIVKNFKGKVVEMAGDSLYAVFGLQTTVKEAVAQAYESTKMIFETMNWFNAAYALPRYGHDLEIGMGLHAGKVLVGRFGLETPQLAVMGLPVNVASRLQAKTKEVDNDLVISEEAYSLLNINNPMHEQRTVTLQGISTGQSVRLAGKPYSGNLISMRSEFDYLLAISG